MTGQGRVRQSSHCFIPGPEMNDQGEVTSGGLLSPDRECSQTRRYTRKELANLAMAKKNPQESYPGLGTADRCLPVLSLSFMAVTAVTWSEIW